MNRLSMREVCADPEGFLALLSGEPEMLETARRQLAVYRDGRTVVHARRARDALDAIADGLVALERRRVLEVRVVAPRRKWVRRPAAEDSV